MSKDPKRMAAQVGTNQEIAEKLDQLLNGPNDRAFIVCTYADCKHFSNGRCTIFTVMDVPRMRTGHPCDRYESQVMAG